MIDCYLWEGDEQITLKYIEEEDLSAVEEVNHCLKALKELEHIIQPLSIEFIVKFRHRKRLAYSFELMPEVPYWHWEISPVPPDISTFGFYTGIARIIPVKNITTNNLKEWIKKPLQQKSPDSEYDVWWSEINICATRARIIDEIRFADRDYYLVSTRYGEYRFPIIRNNKGLWVYGSLKSYAGYPPRSDREILKLFRPRIRLFQQLWL